MRYVVVVVVTRNEEKEAYPSAEDLVDGGALFERAFGYHFGPHLLHVEHERVQRLLDVRLRRNFSHTASSVLAVEATEAAVTDLETEEKIPVTPHLELPFIALLLF